MTKGQAENPPGPSAVAPGEDDSVATRGRRLTDDEERQIVDLYVKSRISVQEIATRMAVSRQTVYGVLQRRGVRPARQGIEATPPVGIPAAVIPVVPELQAELLEKMPSWFKAALADSFIEKLAELEAENRELRQRVEALEAQVARFRG
jgi:transposase